MKVCIYRAMREVDHWNNWEDTIPISTWSTNQKSVLDIACKEEYPCYQWQWVPRGRVSKELRQPAKRL